MVDPHRVSAEMLALLLVLLLPLEYIVTFKNGGGGVNSQASTAMLPLTLSVFKALHKHRKHSSVL